ncbi:hypothetical protein KC19_4G253900 [Ceratodon purpureus]|uniref:Uncharacterized protein n=1 Tax=Ceratodon purpureus TaxID=3225 RepID=A0A8T0IG47_CERPU|nr:hypothetical protein KC19_4G253900 [Ceratodon purpureus]
MGVCEVLVVGGGGEVAWLRVAMAGPSVASFVSEYSVSVSQEEELANVGEGWERSGLYSLDETPSQNSMQLSPPRVQRNSLTLHAEPPASYGGDSGSESSESVDGEGDMGFTQEPVEWMSPPSSLQATVGGEGNDRVEKEDSYVAAFESDRSRSPSQEWHGQSEQPDPQVTIPNLGVSAEFFTQPVAGVTEFQFASSEDVENHILMRETIPEAEFQGSSLLLSPIPENAVSVVEASVVLMESSLQPFTQPAFETQPPEPLPLESLNKLQEPVQEGSGRDELVKDAPAADDDNGCTGEQMPTEGGVDGLSSDSQLPVNDGKNPGSTEHMQQEHGSHVITKDVPHVERDPAPSDNAQLAPQNSEVVELGTGRISSDSDQRKQMQSSNGDRRSFFKRLKRVNCVEELHGQQKRQRREASPARVRSFPKTVMDVVRSRSRSLSNPLVDDESNILSIIMRAGVSFPPFVHEKRSV